jgi:osmotically inducible lipoprotein OsmB
MNARIAQIAVSSALVLSLAACGGMTTREQDTVVGAGIGAAAGAAITGDVGGARGDQAPHAFRRMNSRRVFGPSVAKVGSGDCRYSCRS